MKTRQGGRKHIFAGMSSNPEIARFKCFMEGVERCAGLSLWAMETLAKSVESNRSLAEFFPYSDEQVKWLEKLRSRQPTMSVAAQDLVDGSIHFIPAEAVFPWWKSFSECVLPLPETDGVGFAAGFSDRKSETTDRALCEVLERDALMLSWKVPNYPKINLDRTLLHPDLQDEFAIQNLSYRLLDIGSEHGIRVVITLLTDHLYRTTIGVACGGSTEQDIQKSALEALMLRGSALLMSQENRQLTHQIMSSEDHVLWGWFNGKKVWDWYKPTHMMTQRNVNHDPLTACVNLGLGRPLLVDTTPPDFRTEGFYVCRVIVPHAFRKEYNHAYRYTGGKRLKDLGLMSEQLNHLPHPIG